ncbi:putative quinol monooxygenase [Acidipropionibacterium timonense]|uniref:putative quinol monooxygenase n=1 Tax=Acidipropionibacterium timonense TaxID=2161818 RepID=UPI001030B9B3|nr:putative quinol monooxygenase [Acidipropionibacterium timonense]
MRAITVKWDVKPEYADSFLDLTRDFTLACRAEPGCLWFEWSKSVEEPNVFVLLEAYRDEQACIDHVQSEHFKEAMATQGRYAATRPKIVSVEADQDGWNELGEIHMDD